MSKKIFTTLLIVFSFSFCKAQWVTIPDANFVTWLQSNYPSCMNGNLMNISCSAITTATQMDCSSQNISDLTGIEYFTSLVYLYCDNNQLSNLPTLSNSLIALHCSENQLHSLPNMPSSIDELNCSYNYLYFLPPLPVFMNTLNISHNEFVELHQFPVWAGNFDCSYNNMSLITQSVNACNFNCSHNQFTTLPPLSSICSIDCSYNLLSSLSFIPYGAIPDFTGLACSHNQISSITNLPSSLFWLDVSFNSGLICIPELQSIIGTTNGNFNISNTGINCLPNLINHTGYIAAIDTMPICTCTYPSGISTSNITSTSAKVNWSTQCCSQFQIQARVNGTTAWSTLTALSTAVSRTISPLTPGTTYDLRMRVKCTDAITYSSWSPIQTFTTLVTCVAPIGITVSNLTQTHATINWAAVANAYCYKLQGRKLGTTTWTTYTIIAPLTVKQLNGLTANTTYQYRMQTVCNASGVPTSPWTAISTFSTPLRMEGESMENATIDFTIYPNPVSQLLTVTADFSIGDEIEIKDLLGRTLITQTSIEESSNTIDVSNLSAAQYFISIRRTDGSVLIKQFVKE